MFHFLLVVLFKMNISYFYIPTENEWSSICFPLPFMSTLTLMCTPTSVCILTLMCTLTSMCILTFFGIADAPRFQKNSSKVIMGGSVFCFDFSLEATLIELRVCFINTSLRSGPQRGKMG